VSEPDNGAMEGGHGIVKLERLILRAAVWSAMEGEYDKLDRCARLRERFGSPPVRMLLVQVGLMRDEGASLSDILTELAFRELPRECDLLEEFQREAAMVSPSVWAELMEKLNRPWAVARLGRLAQLARDEDQETGTIIRNLGGLKEALEKETGEGKNGAVHEVHRAYPADPVAVVPPAFAAGLLMHGYVNASGPPKTSFKTLFNVGLCLAIHTGKPFLGRSVERAVCTWVQLDMPEADFQKYVERIGLGMGFPEAHLPYMCSGKIDLANRAQWPPFFEVLRGLGTKVLFVDSSRATSSTLENDSDEVRGLVRTLFCGHLRDTLGITTVLITHSPKGGSGARGSGEWVGAADSEWRFEPQSSGTVKIKGLGRHPAFELTFALEENGENLALKAVTEEEERQREAFSASQLEMVCTLIRKNPDGLSMIDIQGALKDAGMGIRRILLRSFQDRLLQLNPTLAVREQQGRRGGKPKRIIFFQSSQDSSTEDSINERKDLL